MLAAFCDPPAALPLVFRFVTRVYGPNTAARLRSCRLRGRSTRPDRPIDREHAARANRTYVWWFASASRAANGVHGTPVADSIPVARSSQEA
jgi:hypothetical protein